jgi:CubicO group peptidase (beta-lactamase class C family)
VSCQAYDVPEPIAKGSPSGGTLRVKRDPAGASLQDGMIVPSARRSEPGFDSNPGRRPAIQDRNVTRPSRRSWILLLALGFLFGEASPRAAAAKGLTPAAIDSLRARVRTFLEESKAPSVAIAVTQGGRTVWEEGFGFADVERRVPATPATLYSIASVTKPITATAVMRLVEQGRIDLDRPANDYLGDGKITGLAADAAGATVRRVLSHSAGLPVHYRFFYEGGAVARPSMDEASARYAFVAYPPGRVYNYSNLDYGVLETILERASGRPFAEVVRDEVFRPYGMTASAVGTGAGIANAAVRYSATGTPVPFYDFDHRGASAAWTSARDLARFARFHLGDRVPDARPPLRETTRALMQRVATPGDPRWGYGLGWDVGRELGTTVVSHNGEMPGVAATLRLYPEHDVSIVVLSNASTGLPGRVARSIAEAVLPKPASDLDSNPPVRAAPPLQPALQGTWNGKVRTYDGATTPFHLEIREDDVHVRLGGEGAFWVLLNATRFIDGIQVLWGAFPGAIPSEEAGRFPHDIVLSLWFDGGRLVGAATAITKDRPQTGAMSSYVELSRAPPARPPSSPSGP